MVEIAAREGAMSLGIHGVIGGLLLLSGLCVAPALSAEPPPSFRDHLLDGRPCDGCPAMRRVPAGRFLMGALPGEGHDNELGPGGLPFPVDIGADLAVGVAEVSVAEFTAFMAANPDIASADSCAGLVDGIFQRSDVLSWSAPGFSQRDDHPVVCVSWHAASAYTQWLSDITGQPYRLLSEAEWEYVARAGSPLRYWWGDGLLPGRANCLDSVCGDGHPFTAGTDDFEANAWGFANTSGNVWEWMEDCYYHDAYLKFSDGYPASAPCRAGCGRVLRGGSWQDGAWSLRAANRQCWKPEVGLNDVGFRVAREGAELPGTLVLRD